jgi:hypothetical protein
MKDHPLEPSSGNPRRSSGATTITNNMRAIIAIGTITYLICYQLGKFLGAIGFRCFALWRDRARAKHRDRN